MREQGLALADVTQHEVDAWLAGNPGTRYEVSDFAVWAHRRGHSHPLLVPHRPKAAPEGLDEDSHWNSSSNASPTGPCPWRSAQPARFCSCSASTPPASQPCPPTR
ncbi:hypothetical protein AB0D54_31290 [Streptomyces xanthophaeus]|uniref:hypothetical protein n=1 Tax=Streptomyces xanthophaeus TaxID=67385 RepID=UPI0034180D17